MKVTALLPDDLVSEVREFTRAKNLTDSLVIALTEWRALQKLQAARDRVRRAPLVFRRNFSACAIRSLNRKKW